MKHFQSTNMHRPPNITPYEIDKRARSCFETSLPTEWTFSSPRDDFGIDYWVQIVEAASPTGLSFYVQLKGTTRHTAGDYISARISHSNAAAYSIESKPILFVICDVASKEPANHQAYYCWIQEHLRHLNPEDRDSKYITIKISTRNKLDKNASELHLLDYIRSTNEIHKRRSTKFNADSFFVDQKGNIFDAYIKNTFGEKGHPASSEVKRYIYSGADYIKKGQLREAIQELKFAQWLIPTPFAAIQLGNCHLQQDREEEAISAYDDALALDPKNAPCLSNKGSALFRLGRVEEALTCHDEAARLDPSDPKLLSNVAATLQFIAATRDQESQDRLFIKSISYYDRALAVSPNDDFILTEAALVHSKRYNFLDAMRLLERATTINPSNSSAWRRLHRAYIMLNLQTKAEFAESQFKRLNAAPEPLD